MVEVVGTPVVSGSRSLFWNTRGSAPASTSQTSNPFGQSPERRTLFRYTPFPDTAGGCPPSGVPLAITSPTETQVVEMAVPPPETVLEWTSTSFGPALFTTCSPNERALARVHAPPGAGGTAPTT